MNAVNVREGGGVRGGQERTEHMRATIRLTGKNGDGFVVRMTRLPAAVAGRTAFNGQQRDGAWGNPSARERHHPAAMRGGGGRGPRRVGGDPSAHNVQRIHDITEHRGAAPGGNVSTKYQDMNPNQPHQASSVHGYAGQYSI